MDRSEQTEELKLRLYNLTKSFTHALVGRYYYQFRGDVDDLASEFFLQFITPKARKGMPKESLLDKFNPETTSLEYLVKVCVVRKLIDQSRQNPQVYHSIDALTDDNGDIITLAFNLVVNDKHESTLLQDPRFIAKVITGFKQLPEEERNKHFVAIFDSQSPLAKVLQPVLHFVRNCPIQQVTDKTVVLYIPEARQVVNFSLEDGHARGTFQPFTLNKSELSGIKALGQYHSQFTRELFIEYMGLVQ